MFTAVTQLPKPVLTALPTEQLQLVWMGVHNALTEAGFQTLAPARAHDIAFGVIAWLGYCRDSLGVYRPEEKVYAEDEERYATVKVADGRWTAEVPIVKKDEDQHLAFGWLYVSKDKRGAVVVDHSGETIGVSELEQAAYGFMLNSRKGSEMHTRRDSETDPVAKVVESVVFTREKQEALGIPEGHLPEAWWVGLKIADDEVWEKVKDGTYSAFSLGGRATPVSV